jgi:hypothetical protein
MNKAEALADHLNEQIPSLQAGALPWMIDDHLQDSSLDVLISWADLVVAATDDRAIQRRLGRRALSLDIPAIFPSLYRNGGGEVFVQYNSESPCFLCWDAFRPADESPRGVIASSVDTLSVIGLAAELVFGVLDGDSTYARLLAEEPGTNGLPQLYILNRHEMAARPGPRRSNCQSCAVGPPPSRPQQTAPAQGGPAPQPNPPPSPWVSRQAPSRPSVEELQQRVRSTAYSALGTAAGIVIITTILLLLAGAGYQFVGLGLAPTWIIGLWILYVETTNCFEAWEAFRRARNRINHELRQQK